jgi:hypothetical protein
VEKDDVAIEANCSRAEAMRLVNWTATAGFAASGPMQQAPTNRRNHVHSHQIRVAEIRSSQTKGKGASFTSGLGGAAEINRLVLFCLPER